MAEAQAGHPKNVRRAIVHRTGKRFLRAIRNFQGRHSRITTAPIIARESLPWVADLEAAWVEIRREFDRVWQRPEDIPTFHQLSPDQARISKGDNWKTYALVIFGAPIMDNCAACPRTAELLRSVPSLRNAWFSVLAPGYHIPPHRGPTRALVRCHLALRVPREQEKCWIRVDTQRVSWHEGRCLLFDDTYEHEVLNDTSEFRAVLFIDFDRPMDRTGAWFNRAVLRLMQYSHYVKDPLRNLAAWNRALRDG